MNTSICTEVEHLQLILVYLDGRNAAKDRERVGVWCWVEPPKLKQLMSKRGVT